MTKQLHKRFSTEEVEIFLKKYLTENLKLMYILAILQIIPRQFSRLLKAYRKDPDGFSFATMWIFILSSALLREEIACRDTTTFKLMRQIPSGEST